MAIVFIGLSCVVSFAALLWAWPSALERTLLGAYPPAASWRVFVPFSSAWLRLVRPDDFAHLGGLRRRVLVAVAVVVLVWGAAFIAFPGEHEVASTVVVTRTRVQPASEATRPSDPVPAPARPRPAPSASPATQPHSDPSADIEPLAAKRTQTRLFGSAKVKAVYVGHDVHGVRIERVDPGSFWEILGIEAGDVVVERDGDPIDTPADMVALLNALEREVVIHLRVRDAEGRERWVDYETPE